ncbi:MAG TPA: HEPN/Toprim-associated domain-containing protein [Candidatus Sulfotelmatobacter sp.]
MRARVPWDSLFTENARDILKAFHPFAAKVNINQNMLSLLEGLVGTEITLDVGGVAITYSKNDRGMDHGSLFQEPDRRPVRSEQLNYDYYESKNEDPTSAEMAFIRPLKDVVPRLELLGFSLSPVRREYESVAESWRAQRESFLDDDTSPLPDLMSFAEFRQFAIEHALESLDDTFVSSENTERAEKIRGRFADAAVDRIPNYLAYDPNAYSERSFFGGLVGILHPYSVMRLLAEGKENGNASVIWQYGPLLDAGWATEQEFVAGARRTETFLIATEGSSDVHILKHALALLRPGIADFFRFIDVSESHLFSGTGNLVKFAEGLAKIDVQNQVVFLFDNDAEGLDAHQRLSRLTLPTNMRGTMLPELDAFRAFPAQGPEGLRNADINRRAAAIECYLDLNAGGHAAAKVLWTNYKKTLGVYQGALEYKEFYVQEFLKQTSETIADGSYDVTRMEALLDLLIAECTAIPVKGWNLSSAQATPASSV